MPHANLALNSLTQTTLADVLESKLSVQNPLENATFIDDVWRFKMPSHVVTIDFALFASSYLQFTGAITASFGGQSTQLTLTEFAKLMWLEITMGKSVHPKLYHQVRDMLALLMAYLHSEGLTQLDVSNLEGFYSTCLMQNSTEMGLKPRLASPAYNSRFEGLTLPAMKRILTKYNISGVIGHITSRQCDEALNDACLAMLDMTRLEYKKGGSFNFLGLEVGKHYIDHCQHLFEHHCAYVTAIRRATAMLFDEQSHRPEFSLGKNPTNRLLGRVFIGEQIDHSDFKEKHFKTF
jgi:hypothetical protein